MADCIFCSIINREIPSKIVYEDDKIMAFHDVAPMAPVHVIFIPKVHVCCANEITPETSGYIARIFEVIPKVAKELGIAEGGYRIVNNCGENGGQTVKHLHLHLLGGKKLNTDLA